MRIAFIAAATAFLSYDEESYMPLDLTFGSPHLVALGVAALIASLLLCKVIIHVLCNAGRSSGQGDMTAKLDEILEYIKQRGNQ